MQAVRQKNAKAGFRKKGAVEAEQSIRLIDVNGGVGSREEEAEKKGVEN